MINSKLVLWDRSFRSVFLELSWITCWRPPKHQGAIATSHAWPSTSEQKWQKRSNSAVQPHLAFKHKLHVLRTHYTSTSDLLMFLVRLKLLFQPKCSYRGMREGVRYACSLLTRCEPLGWYVVCCFGEILFKVYPTKASNSAFNTSIAGMFIVVQVFCLNMFALNLVTCCFGDFLLSFAYFLSTFTVEGCVF